MTSETPGSRLDRLYSPPEIGAPGRRRARAQRRSLLLAGTFVLAMVLAAMGMLLILTPGLFGRVYRVQAYFPNAEGLDAGVQVLQAGYVIGLVERVTPLFPGRDAAAARCPGPADTADGPRPAASPCFRATLRIRRDWPVPSDSLAQLGSAGLLKGEAIKIRPGYSSRSLRPGEVIAVSPSETTLAGQLGDLTQTLQRLVDETIAPALTSLRDQIRTIETLLGTGADQGENRERLAGAFENLRGLSARLRDSVDPQAVAAILESVRTMSAHLARMSAALDESTGDIQRAVTGYGDLAFEMRGLVRENRPALQQSLDDTQYLLQELSAALTPILTNIEDATRDLSALSRELRQDPKSILRGHETEDRTPWFQ